MYPYVYQLDFVMPGISPRDAFSRKHSLHNPKYLITECDLPQRQHLFTCLTANFDFCAFKINAFLAILND